MGIYCGDCDSLSSEVIRRIFPELHRKYPDITLECISAGTQEMFRLLNQNEADIVYTLDNHIYDTNYVIQQESRIGVHFVCAAGNALAARRTSGRDGAGKSTLMNVLYGLYQADEGEIRINGQKEVIKNPNKAIELGIGMVHQHFMLVEPFYSYAEHYARYGENTVGRYH